MSKYNVFLLDMYEEYGLWYENCRDLYGEIELESEPSIDILEEKSDSFSIRLMTGREIYPFDDLNDYYIVDYYGDGTWYEIVCIADDCPVYGLQLKEESK